MGRDFDFGAFKSAFEGQDLEAWAACFHADAEWVEYRHDRPPSRPHVMRGRHEIAAFLPRVAAANLRLAIEDEMGAGGRYAFRAVATRVNGERVIEHVMLYVEDGLIRRQVDVEAWD